MNTNAQKRFRSYLHEPKSPLKPRCYRSLTQIDKFSQKYFEDTTMIDPSSGILLSDIEVLNDTSTPSILKDYIQQHSCRVVPSSDSIPSSLVDKLNPFDYIVPNDCQTQSELENHFRQTGLNISSNNIESFNQ